MIDRSHYAVTSVSRPERLAEAQAEIDAAVEAYLQAGGTITQIADHLEVAPGTVRRIAREHGIELAGQRQAEAGAR